MDHRVHSRDEPAQVLLAEYRAQVCGNGHRYEFATDPTHHATSPHASTTSSLSWSKPADATDWRVGIRQRHQQLAQRRTQAEAKLAELTTTQPIINEGGPALLDAMPQAVVDLARVPPTLQRQLFDALQLAIRLDNPRQAHVTLTADRQHPAGHHQHHGGHEHTKPLPRQRQQHTLRGREMRSCDHHATGQSWPCFAISDSNPNVPVIMDLLEAGK